MRKLSAGHIVFALASTLAYLAMGVVEAAQVHVDTFEASFHGWSTNSENGVALSLPPSGGPEGSGDAFLQATSTTKLATINTSPAWIGDYTAIDAPRLRVDLMNPVGQPELEIRVVLFEAESSLKNSARWTTISSADLVADGQWRTFEFALAEENMSLVANTGTFGELMADVGQVMLRHDAGTPSMGGDFVAGTIGIDNVALVSGAVNALAGDYNDNGRVDLADYTLWRDHLGGPATALANNVNGSLVGPAHYQTWRAAFDSPASGAASSAVPELPASIVGSLCACMLVIAATRLPRCSPATR